jgi:transcriptional regulator with XRE-family HTH domain
MTTTTIVDVAELGRRIRKLRMERRLTLKQVEDGCGLSATHLSEIERGRTSPTIGALVRIARSLGKDASYFIELDERPDAAHVTRERSRSLTPAPGVTAEVMTRGIPGSQVFAYRLKLEGELTLEPSPTDGEAIYLVERGSLEAQFGDSSCTLGEGDAVQASLALPHRLRGSVERPAEVLAMLTRSLEEAV